MTTPTPSKALLPVRHERPQIATLSGSLTDEIADLFDEAQALGGRYRDTELSLARGVALDPHHRRLPKRRQSERRALCALARLL